MNKLLLALLAVVLLFSAFYYHTRHPAYLPPLELQTSTGIVPLSRYAGKPLLLYFWSPTCGICMDEIPDLIRLHDDLDDRLTIVSISMPYDSPNQVLSTSRHYQMPYVIGMDLDGQAAKAMSVFATPTSFLVAPDNRIVDAIIGSADFAELRQQAVYLAASH